MKYKLHPLWFIVPGVAGITAGFIAASAPVGLAVFAALLMPAMIALYIPYARNNPNNVWFKRKLFGWGWTPVTWQGWGVTGLYIALMIAFAFTIDENSPHEEVAFTFLIPAVLLTIAFIRIAYAKGERPRWQWGEEKNDSL